MTPTRTPLTPASAGYGTGVQAVSATTTNVNPSFAYEYRLVATNSLGSHVGAFRSFTISPPAPPAPPVHRRAAVGDAGGGSGSLNLGVTLSRREGDARSERDGRDPRDRRAQERHPLGDTASCAESGSPPTRPSSVRRQSTAARVAPAPRSSTATSISWRRCDDRRPFLDQRRRDRQQGDHRSAPAAPDRHRRERQPGLRLARRSSAGGADSLGTPGSGGSTGAVKVLTGTNRRQHAQRIRRTRRAARPRRERPAVRPGRGSIASSAASATTVWSVGRARTPSKAGREETRSRRETERETSCAVGPDGTRSWPTGWTGSRATARPSAAAEPL